MGTKTSIMKEITLKEWAAYLTYETKFQSYMDVPFEEMERNSTWTLDGVNRMFGYHCLLTKEKNDAYAIGTCKPIMRDLSDLTKEIEHNGEKFVPIDKISIYANNEFYLIEQINTGMVEKIVFDMLISWHFNFFQIPDELIVKVTEEFNPYK